VKGTCQRSLFFSLYRVRILQEWFTLVKGYLSFRINHLENSFRNVSKESSKEGRAEEPEREEVS
jgi:hypothetical protein